jgi:hypothetical protein
MRFYTEVPEKTSPLAMWPLAMAGGAGRPNSGDSGEGSGREIVGEGARAHLGLIGARVGVGRPATSAADGGGWRLPLQPASRRGCRSCRAIRGSGGCGGGSWWRVRARMAVLWHGGGSSPWAAMATRWQLAVQAGAGACVREAAWLPSIGDGRLISGLTRTDRCTASSQKARTHRDRQQTGGPRRATGVTCGRDGFQRASVRKRPGEGARALGRHGSGPVAKVEGARRAQRELRGRRGAASRSGAKMFHCALVRLRFPPDFEIEVHQSVNREIVDLTTLYNFHKGCMVIFSMVFAGTACQH